MRPHDVLVEQTEHDAAELAVAIFLEVFQRQYPGDDLAAGIGLAFALLSTGFERLQLGVELIAFLAQELGKH